MKVYKETRCSNCHALCDFYKGTNCQTCSKALDRWHKKIEQRKREEQGNIAIVAYEYAGDSHCIDCTSDRFGDNFSYLAITEVLHYWSGLIPNAEEKAGRWAVGGKYRACTKGCGYYDCSPSVFVPVGLGTLKNNGNSKGTIVYPVFTNDEFLTENPAHYFVCGDCDDLIDEYSAWMD